MSGLDNQGYVRLFFSEVAFRDVPKGNFTPGNRTPALFLVASHVPLKQAFLRA